MNASATNTELVGEPLERAPILVTGGTGFIGRHVVARLLEGGRRVRVPCRQGVLPEWRNEPGLEIVECTDLATADLEALVAGCAVVVHLAGIAQVGKRDRADPALDFTRFNDELTARLTSAAHTAEVISFVYLSSVFAVTSNTADGVVNDLTDSPPATPYGRSKRAAEGHVRELAEAGRFAVSLRPPLVVGADARGNWRSLQKLAATGLPLPFGSIANRRSFIGVEALSEAIALLCSRPWPAALSGAYSVADPESLSLPEVLTELRHGMGLAPALLPCPPVLFDALGALTGRRRQLAGLTGSLEVDGARFATTFGFTPTFAIREAIRRAGAEFRDSQQAAGSAAGNRASAPGMAAAPRRVAGAAKRLVDVVLALCAGIVALPFVLVAMAAIRLTSPGPALFRQVRVGRKEQRFVCLKLRTMRQNTRNAPSHEISVSSVTALGRFLRRSKLDELPQLWNILRGEMSFVGPRPCLPTQTALIDARRRYGLYALRPGITGVAQVAGVDMSDPERLAALDATYLADQSLAHDLQLIAATFFGAGRGDRTQGSRRA